MLQRILLSPVVTPYPSRGSSHTVEEPTTDTFTGYNAAVNHHQPTTNKRYTHTKDRTRPVPKLQARPTKKDGETPEGRCRWTDHQKTE
jgi:hypothetical protein